MCCWCWCCWCFLPVTMLLCREYMLHDTTGSRYLSYPLAVWNGRVGLPHSVLGSDPIRSVPFPVAFRSGTRSDSPPPPLAFSMATKLPDRGSDPLGPQLPFPLPLLRMRGRVGGPVMNAAGLYTDNNPPVRWDQFRTGNGTGQRNRSILVSNGRDPTRSGGPFFVLLLLLSLAATTVFHRLFLPAGCLVWNRNRSIDRKS